MKAADVLHAHRRHIAAALAAVAMILGVSALRPHPPASTRVWVAARDLSGGAALGPGDLRSELLPRADVPNDALPAAREPIGVVLGAPVRRGEPLTDVRMLSVNLLAASGAPDDLAVPVRVTDGPSAVVLVKAGELITVIASGDQGTGVAGPARTVVEDVRVLAVPGHLTDDDSGLIIVAATPRQAAALARISVADRISVAVRR
jgi:Flp pilus assembly protein CpaB